MVCKKQVAPLAETPEQEIELKAVIAEFKDQPGALMPVIQKAQDIYGYLLTEVQIVISDKMGIPLEKVHGVSTPYAQFALQPKSEYKVPVCLGAACCAKGSGDIFNKPEELSGITNGECIADGKFPLDSCQRVDTCGLVPIMMINGKVCGRLTVDDIPGILAKYN